MLTETGYSPHQAGEWRGDICAPDPETQVLVAIQGNLFDSVDINPPSVATAEDYTHPSYNQLLALATDIAKLEIERAKHKKRGKKREQCNKELNEKRSQLDRAIAEYLGVDEGILTDRTKNDEAFLRLISMRAKLRREVEQQTSSKPNKSLLSTYGNLAIAQAARQQPKDPDAKKPYEYTDARSRAAGDY